MEKIFNFGSDTPYEILNNNELKNIQNFIIDFFNYTITISVSEVEWLNNFEWLENTNIIGREATDEDYHKEALKDLLFDLFFHQKGIKEQLENDIENYGEDSEEMDYIKEFYNKWKYLFNFKIEKLEAEQLWKV